MNNLHHLEWSISFLPGLNFYHNNKCFFPSHSYTLTFYVSDSGKKILALGTWLYTIIYIFFSSRTDSINLCKPFIIMITIVESFQSSIPFLTYFQGSHLVSWTESGTNALLGLRIMPQTKFLNNIACICTQSIVANIFNNSDFKISCFLKAFIDFVAWVLDSTGSTVLVTPQNIKH